MSNFLYLIRDVENTLSFLKLQNSRHEKDSNPDNRTTKRELYPPNHSAKFSIFLTRNSNPNIKANRKQSKLM